MTKEEIRNLIRVEKRSLTKDRMDRAGEVVSEILETFPLYLEIDTIYCYASYNQELPTKRLIENALNAGKKVALPKVEGKNIRFYYINDFSQVATGYQNIPEPTANIIAAPTVDQPVLMLLPGLAYTMAGHRLGYGGGFYDRYLSKVADGAIYTCGIGYDFQVLKELPKESYDIPVEYLITPSMLTIC